MIPDIRSKTHYSTEYKSYTKDTKLGGLFEFMRASLCSDEDLIRKSNDITRTIEAQAETSSRDDNIVMI